MEERDEDVKGPQVNRAAETAVLPIAQRHGTGVFSDSPPAHGQPSGCDLAGSPEPGTTGSGAHFANAVFGRIHTDRGRPARRPADT